MENIIFTSVARRLERGEFVVTPRMRAHRIPAPTMPVETPSESWCTIVAPYLGSALLGALLALAFNVQP